MTISSVISLNGVTRIIEFASQAQHDSLVMFTAPLSDEIEFAKLFFVFSISVFIISVSKVFCLIIFIRE